MFDPSTIMVGLEVGTSKVCVTVGEYNSSGSVNIVGVGQARSRGVRKGEIVDPRMAEEDIRLAISEAEQMSDVEIQSVYLGVSGSHIQGVNNRGMHPIVATDREIQEDDVQDVIKNAKAVNMSAEHYVMHAIRQHFIVDGHDSIRNPAGMFGSRLEVDMHVIVANLNRLQNSIRVVKGLKIDVEDVVFNGLAAALTSLTSEQKELGALVIDFGGGSTDYVVYSGGIVKHTGSIAVGGDHVSNDIAYGLKVSCVCAEQLKIDHGAAIVDESVRGQSLTIPGETGMPDRTIDVESLRLVMNLRLEETIQYIYEDLERHGLLDYLRAGVFLCGGGARTPQIQKLVGDMFGLAVDMGKATRVSGLKAALDQPEFASGIGLVKFASFQQAPPKGKGTLSGGIRRRLGSWINAGKRFLF
jgi:cell division protein FtsA